MKKWYYTSLFTAALLLLSSCLSTLHPIFNTSDLVSWPTLPGEWQNATQTDKQLFRLANPADLQPLSPELRQQIGKIYIVTIPKDNPTETETYYAFLVKIGGKHYLDYYPFETPSNKKMDPFFKAHFVKMHQFFQVAFQPEGTFHIRQFDQQFLDDLIKKRQISIPHETMNDGSYLITASTAELQQYIIKYSGNPKAYVTEATITYKKINHA